MDRIAFVTGYTILGVAAWGCFTLLTGFAKPPRGPFVVGWKARMLGLLAIMSIPTSWTLGYGILIAAMLIGVSPSGEFVVIAANVGASIAAFAAMHYFAGRWEQMDQAPATALETATQDRLSSSDQAE